MNTLPTWDLFSVAPEDEKRKIWDGLISLISSLTSTVEDLKKEVGELRAEREVRRDQQPQRIFPPSMDPTHSTDGSTFEEKVIACLDTYFEHKEEKEEKKNNLVIYGLPESENPDTKVRQAEERETVDSIIEKSGLDVSVILEVFRMQKRT